MIAKPFKYAAGVLKAHARGIVGTFVCICAGACLIAYACSNAWPWRFMQEPESNASNALALVSESTQASMQAYQAYSSTKEACEQALYKAISLPPSAYGYLCYNRVISFSMPCSAAKAQQQLRACVADAGGEINELALDGAASKVLLARVPVLREEVPPGPRAQQERAGTTQQQSGSGAQQQSGAGTTQQHPASGVRRNHDAISAGKYVILTMSFTTNGDHCVVVMQIRTSGGNRG